MFIYRRKKKISEYHIKTSWENFAKRKRVMRHLALPYKRRCRIFANTLNHCIKKYEFNS